MEKYGSSLWVGKRLIKTVIGERAGARSQETGVRILPKDSDRLSVYSKQLKACKMQYILFLILPENDLLFRH
jgi:hypothetical protein